jgi:IMP cyclohydrolase
VIKRSKNRNTYVNVLTINVPMTGRLFFFAGKTYNGTFLGIFRGSKRSMPPRKIPRNAPLYVLPQTKKIISRAFKIRCALVLKRAV